MCLACVFQSLLPKAPSLIFCLLVCLFVSLYSPGSLKAELALNSQRSDCLCLLNAGGKGMWHCPLAGVGFDGGGINICPQSSERE